MKEKKLDKQINLMDKVNKINDLDLEFDFDSENNLDIAISKALLYSLTSFSKSKIIKSRLLKSMTFLSLTNDIVKESIEKLELNYINEKGKGRKNWNDIIKQLSKSLSRNYDKQKWYSKLLNR